MDSRKSPAREARPVNAPMALTIKDAVRTTGLSRTRIFAAIRDGHLTAKKAGKATIVLGESLQAYLDGLPSARRADHKEAA